MKWMLRSAHVPMNGVVGMAEVLRQSRLDAGAAEAVGIIRNSAFSLLRIVVATVEAGLGDLLDTQTT